MTLLFFLPILLGPPHPARQPSCCLCQRLSPLLVGPGCLPLRATTTSLSLNLDSLREQFYSRGSGFLSGLGFLLGVLGLLSGVGMSVCLLLPWDCSLFKRILFWIFFPFPSGTLWSSSMLCLCFHHMLWLTDVYLFVLHIVGLLCTVVPHWPLVSVLCIVCLLPYSVVCYFVLCLL